MNPVEQLESLVEILAGMDAPFVPIRDWSGAYPANIAAARTAYRHTGSTWHGQSAGAAARMKAARIRGRLAAGGFIRIAKSKSDRATGHFLTDRGQAVARAAVGLPSVRDAIAMADRIFNIQHQPGAWVPETSLVDVQYERTSDPEERAKLVSLENVLLPLLGRGLVESGSTMQGHVAYRLVDGGDKPSSLISFPKSSGGKLPEVSEALAARYFDTIKATLSRIRALPMPRDLGIIPITPAVFAVRERA